MTAIRGFCNLCKSKKDKLYKLRENFLDTTLYNVINSILAGQHITFPLRFLICNECALELLQAELVFKRLRKVFLSDKRNEDIASEYASMHERDSVERQNDTNAEGEGDDVGANVCASKAHKRPLDFDTLIRDWKFYCTHCDYTSKKASWYKRHLISKHRLEDPSIYQCIYCTERFKKADAIKYHLDSEHGSKSLPNQGRHHVDRTEHLITTSADHDKATEDNINTTNTFKSTSDFDNLLLDWTFECWHCEYKSQNAKWFKRHLITKHKIKNPNIYQCLYCSESYQRVNAIRYHIDRVHGGSSRQTRQRRKTIALDTPTPIVPSHNGIEDEELSEEIGNENESDEEHLFECTLCEHETKNPEVFKTHLMIKHQIVGSKIYKCKKCSCTFVRKGSLQNHTATKHQYQMRRKQRRPQRRKSVPANFQRGPAINTEMEVNDIKRESDSGEDEENLKCNDCPYEAEIYSDLKRHKVMSHEIDNVLNEIATLIDDQIDAQDNGSEEGEHVIEAQNDKQAESNGEAHAKEMASESNEKANADKNVLEAENATQGQTDGSVLSSPLPKNLGSSEVNSHMSLLEIQSKETYIFQANQLNSTITVTETQNDKEISDDELLPHAQKNKLNYQVNSIISSMETDNDDKERSDEELISPPELKNLPSRVNSIISATEIQSDDKAKNDEEHIFQAPQRNLHNKKKLKVSSRKFDKETRQTGNNVTRTPQKQPPQEQKINSSEISRSEWIFLCPFCDYESSKRKAYKEHMTREHELKDKNIYKCIYCTSSYRIYKSLKKHVTSTHCIDLTSAGGFDTPCTYSDSSQDHLQHPYMPNDKSTTKRKGSLESVESKQSPAEHQSLPYSHNRQSPRKRKISLDFVQSEEPAAEHHHLSNLYNIQTPRKRKISLESVECKESAAGHQHLSYLHNIQTPRQRKISLESAGSKESAAATETEAEAALTEVSRNQKVKKRKKVSTCVVCGKIFSSTEKLQAHIARLHGADEMYKFE